MAMLKLKLKTLQNLLILVALVAYMSPKRVIVKDTLHFGCRIITVATFQSFGMKLVVSNVFYLFVLCLEKSLVRCELSLILQSYGLAMFKKLWFYGKKTPTRGKVLSKYSRYLNTAFSLSFFLENKVRKSGYNFSYIIKGTTYVQHG